MAQKKLAENPLRVDNDFVVSMEYELRLDNGEYVDRASQAAPLEYIHGLGQILPDLEKELFGLAAGQVKEVVLEPVAGFGERNPDHVVSVRRDEFPDDFEFVLGKAVGVVDADMGQDLVARIIAIDPETVTLDFNHPLAGERLHFRVKILGLRPASDEELAHGHVHGGPDAED